MSDKTKALLILIFGILIGAPAASFTKIGLNSIPPFTFTFIRFIISAICITPFFLQKKIIIDRTFLKLFLLSLLPIVNIIFYVQGLKLTTANSTLLIQSAIPIITAIFSYLLIREKISGIKWLAIAFGLLGAWLTIILPKLETMSYSGNIFGNLLILIGATAYCIYLVLLKRAHRKFSMITILSIMIFQGLFVFFLLSLTENYDYSRLTSQLISPVSAVILYLAIVITIGSYLLSQFRIKLAGPIAASLDFYLGPPVGFICSYILLGEILTPGLIIGTSIILASVIFISYSK